MNLAAPALKRKRVEAGPGQPSGSLIGLSEEVAHFWKATQGETCAQDASCLPISIKSSSLYPNNECWEERVFAEVPHC
jgi:hypothetical protein